MSDDTMRADQRLAFARAALADQRVALEPASSDASFRSYWRITDCTPSFIVMDAPPDKEDLGPWLDVAARLDAAGIAAPRVVARDLEQGFLLLSDLGSRLLLPTLDASTVEAAYGRGLDVLLRMQRDVRATGLPPYDRDRLVTELELMPTWFLQRHLGFTPACEDWDVIERAFDLLCHDALAQDRVFVHRDFHARNVLLGGDDSWALIDFQDAVTGPITYDLVSLLRDCYIVWREHDVYRWVERFRAQAVDAGLTRADEHAFRRWFDLMGLQRHIKVLGIFCRLWYRDGKSGYLADLPRVWSYARDVGRRYAETAPLIALIERAIGDADLTRARPSDSRTTAACAH